MELKAVGAKDIASIIDHHKKKGHRRMGQVIRSLLMDVYKEAQHAGEVGPGYNPAAATRPTHNSVQQERLNFEQWQTIPSAAQHE